MSSLARAVATRGSGILVVTLALLGAATGALLHVQADRQLDAALVVAGHGSASPGGWSVDHDRPTTRTRVVHPGDPSIPPGLIEEALDRERPVFFDRGRERTALVVVERHRTDGSEEHRVVAATARRPSLLENLWPFLLVYVPLAAAAAGGAAAVLTAVVRHALAPLERAQREASAIRTLSSSARLTEEGPAELRSLVAAINALLVRLEEAHQAQVRFTSEAAHELRTPVTSMLLELDLALRKPRTGAELTATVRSVREEVERLRRLVNGLLALARLDSGNLESGFTDRTVRELVTEALAAEHLSVEPQVDVGDDRIRVHPDLAPVALQNLVRNALRHAPGSPISVRSRCDGPWVHVSVEDRGPGVPESERERMFDRMARSGEARRSDTEGLGLGLPIAREIARRHGGDCRLEGAEGGGCRAVLTFPRAS